MSHSSGRPAREGNSQLLREFICLLELDKRPLHNNYSREG